MRPSFKLTNCKLLLSKTSKSIIIIVIISIVFILNLTLNLSLVETSPIANGYLLSRAFDSRSSIVRRSPRFLRDPMPWEDGYFDPSYHPWPKENRQQQVGDNKQSVRITNQK